MVRDIIKSMRKRFFSFCLIVTVFLGTVFGVCVNVSAVSDEQLSGIAKNCETIKTNLRDLQHTDSRVRVSLNRHYEAVINNLAAPLNVRLIENAISSKNLMDNQNSMVNTQTNFVIDFVEYQRVLEELVGMDCKTNPSGFYNKLKVVREKRGILKEDVAKLKRLMNDQVTIVTSLKESL